jgi:hypothetical protein
MKKAKGSVQHEESKGKKSSILDFFAGMYFL